MSTADRADIVDGCIDAETLAAWAEGVLSAAERARVDAHLADCARCQAMAAMFAITELDASASTEDVGAPVVLPFERPAQSPTSAPAPRLGRWWLPLAGGAIAAGALIFAVMNRAPEPPSVAAPNIAADSTFAQGGDATATVVPPPSETKISVTPPAAAPKALPRVGTAGGNLVPRPQAERVTPPTVTAAAPPPPADPPPVLAPPPPAAQPTIAAPQPAPVIPPAAVAPPPPPASRQITVSAAPPVVDTKKTSTGGTFARDVTETIPPTRDPWSIINMKPGGADVVQIVSPGGAPTASFNVGGSGSGRQIGTGGVGATWTVVDPTAVEWRLTNQTVPTRLKIETPSTERIFGGSSPSDRVCWLIARDAVWVTADATVFKPVNAPSGVVIASITALDGLRATITASTGRQYITEDGGLTWRPRG